MSGIITREHDILEEEYNRYPYQSFPFHQTHPTHLFTIGTLFGINPTPVENSRILELGGASGGNLIPVAHRFPSATCLGMDLSDVQIQSGKKQIDDLKLKNIELRHQSILDFSEQEGKFDYIICHGVFSWVDQEVREKILSICRDNLASNGIAYVSYNTYPGWNMVNSVRDLMMWHTKTIDDPATKAKQARLILKFITDGLKDDRSPYAEFLKGEIQLLMNHADSYLLHDHLSSYNDPIYFYQFMDMANKHNLSYLADAMPAGMFTENLPQSFSKELGKINNIIIAGQYMDFIRNQRFRSTLLCHENQIVNRSLKTNDVEKFYFRIVGAPVEKDLSEQNLQDKSELSITNGFATLTVRHPISKWALYLLHKNRNTYISYDDLCQRIAEKMPNQSMKEIQQYINEDVNLMRAILAGLVLINSYPPDYTLNIDVYPKACPLAQYQLQNQGFVTNKRHEPVRLDALCAAILPHLNGSNDQAALENIIQDLVNNGTLTMHDKDKQPITDPQLIKEYVRNFNQKALETLAIQGLLISS